MNKMAAAQNTRFISSTISLSGFNIIILALGLIGSIVVTRHFSTEVFGTYTLAMVVVSILLQISTFGLDLSISRFISGAKDEAYKEGFLSAAVILRAAAIVLVGLLAWLGWPYLKIFFGASLSPGILVYIIFYVAIESLRTLFKSILQGCLLFPRIGINDLIVSVMNLVLLFMLIYIIKGDLIGLILIKAISSLMACVFAYISIPIKKKVSFKVDFFKKLIKFSFPLQFDGIFSIGYSKIDTLVVAAFLGPADIAFYAVARLIPDNLRTFYQPFRSVYYPFLAKLYNKGEQGQASSFVNDSLRFVAFVALFGTAIAALFSEEIIRLVFSEKYLSSAPVFIVLMFNLSISLLLNLMGTSLIAVGDAQKPPIINIFNAGVSWLGCIILIPFSGILGAAIANTSGTILAYPLNIYFLRKKISLIVAAHLKPVLLFCIWSSLVILVKPNSFSMKAAFLGIFLAGSFFLAIVTKADILRVMGGSGMLSWRPLQKLWVSVKKK
jgi:O-antigen/teichoic acid export membrane protein